MTSQYAVDQPVKHTHCCRLLGIFGATALLCQRSSLDCVLHYIHSRRCEPLQKMNHIERNRLKVYSSGDFRMSVTNFSHYELLLPSRRPSSCLRGLSQ